MWWKPGRGPSMRGGVARIWIVVGLLIALIGSPAQAQANAGRPPFRYGIVANSSANYPEIAKMGFGYVKIYMSWDTIEATQGTFTNFPDFAIQTALANNLQVVALINNAPGWATASGANLLQSAPPSADHVADFGVFMSNLATHYLGKIVAYEIWSEPNLNADWGGLNPDPGLFASMLQAAGSSVHAVDSNAVVVSGGVANDGNGNPPQNIGDLSYIQQLFQDLLNRGAVNDVDAIGIHPYPGPCPPTATSCPAVPGTYFQRAVDEHNALVQAGGSAMPMWITEFGYLSQPGNLDPNAAGCNGGNGLGGFTAYEVDETTKANDLVAAYQNVYATMPWVGMVLMMNLDFAMDTGRATCDPVRFWSILTSTGAETQAYIALQNMVKDTPGIVFNPSPSYAQAQGTVVVTGYAADPTIVGGPGIQVGLASMDAPWTTSSQPIPVVITGNNFSINVDVTHLAVQTTPHLLYVYLLTNAGTWLLEGQGLTVLYQFNVLPVSLIFNITPTTVTVPTQLLTIGRNDQPGTFPNGWSQTNSGESWLLVSNNSTTVTVGVKPSFFTSQIITSTKSYTASVTLHLVQGIGFFQNSTIVVPVTVVVSPSPNLNLTHHLYLPTVDDFSPLQLP